MGRPRSFDETVAMELAVRRFWAWGFNATSVRDLQTATKLGGTSLYNAFGSKRALFLSALEHYSERRTRDCVRHMEQLTAPTERIHTFVARVTETALGDPDQLGCLVINTAIELGPHDPEIASMVNGYLGEVEAFFRRNLEAAQDAGEAVQTISPADAARSLSALMFGLRVLARTRPDRQTMEGATRPLLALLCGDTARTSVPTVQQDQTGIQKETKMIRTRVTPGDLTPEMKLPSVNAGDLYLGGKGRWQVAIIYRGQHCPLCRSYLKTLDGLLEDFGDLGAEVIVISSDPRERAAQEAAEEGWRFPVACELSQDQMHMLGLYISTPRSPEETDRPFAEPGLFVTNPDGVLQIVDVSNAPFARADLQGVLVGLKLIQESNYPIRGTAA